MKKTSSQLVVRVMNLEELKRSSESNHFISIQLSHFTGSLLLNYICSPIARAQHEAGGKHSLPCLDFMHVTVHIPWVDSLRAYLLQKPRGAVT